MGVVYRWWTVGGGREKIFPPKIFSQKIFPPKIFSTKIFQQKIFSPKIFPKKKNFAKNIFKKN